LSKIFKAFDKNGDGKLSKEEIKEGYASYYGKSLETADID
jgi:calcium-dependent protein kinase